MDRQLKKMGLWLSLAIYIPAALLLLAGTTFLIPFLSRTTGMETVLCWFIVAGLGVFLPLVVTGGIILTHEGYRLLSLETWKNRMRFVKLSKRDILWSIGGINGPSFIAIALGAL